MTSFCLDTQVTMWGTSVQCAIDQEKAAKLLDQSQTTHRVEIYENAALAHVVCQQQQAESCFFLINELQFNLRKSGFCPIFLQSSFILN